MKKRLGHILSTAALLAGSVTGTFIAGTTSAQAASCSYSDRLVTIPFHLESGTYVGYVELLYAGGSCRRVETHFHVDSTFRANHSGWNVSIGLFNDPSTVDEVQSASATNSSATDFYTASSPIDGWPDYQFAPGVDWNYNGCQYEISTEWWDFSDGQALGSLGGSGPSAGSPCSGQR